MFEEILSIIKLPSSATNTASALPGLAGRWRRMRASVQLVRRPRPGILHGRDGNDGAEVLNAGWLDAGGDYDCTPWQPSIPVGDAWFTFSIHDTEDGPVCIWVRHRVAP